MQWRTFLFVRLATSHIILGRARPRAQRGSTRGDRKEAFLIDTPPLLYTGDAIADDHNPRTNMHIVCFSPSSRPRTHKAPGIRTGRGGVAPGHVRRSSRGCCSPIELLIRMAIRECPLGVSQEPAPSIPWPSPFGPFRARPAASSRLPAASIKGEPPCSTSQTS